MIESACTSHEANGTKKGIAQGNKKKGRKAAEQWAIRKKQ
jgi:hypothetical protein